MMGIVLLVQFTNCANYNTDSAVSSSSCQDGLCLGPQSDVLSISINENNTISDLHSSKNYVMVSGACATANFPRHKIVVSYSRDGTGFVQKNTYNSVCLDGKYYISLFVGNSDLQPGSVVHVSAQIYGVNASGVEVASQNRESSISLIYPNL